MADFEFRYSTDAAPGSTFTTDPVVPAPTSVEYPERRSYESKVTPDGAVVIQRPLVDSRPRKWIWKGYRSSVPGYNALWTLLKSLEAKQRVADGKNPVIQIKDAATGAGGFDTLTEIKIVQATRQVRAGGGTVTYEDTEITFIVVDSSYSEF